MTDNHDTATRALPAPAAGPAMRMLEVASIETSLTNPRKHFNQAKLQELADSIKASGVHQPVLVRPLPGSRVPETFSNRTPGQPLPAYELVAGERRLRACSMVGVAEIPAMIRELTDDQVLEIQIVENLQRDDLSELEEAEGYEHLMQHSGMTADQVGEKIGKSRSYVYSRLKLTDLCTEARTALREGHIDASKALLIARIPNAELQRKALQEITSKDYDGEPRMNYRHAARYIQHEYMLNLDKARFKISDASLVPAAGSCRECPKRTGHNPDLFDDVKGADVCTDPPCYRSKEQASTDRMLQEAHARGQTIIEGIEAKALMPHSYSTRVDGYLRIDDAVDSPTDKPLRKLIGKAMEKSGITPTLVANPHKNGELIAVLLPEQVTPLLQAAGHDSAANEIQDQAKQSERAQVQKSKEQIKAKFEAEWRWQVLVDTWTAISAKPQATAIDAVLRYTASHFVQLLNTDKAKRLCKLLDLGKVAPKDGLFHYIESTASPSNALQLLTMFRDVEYCHWLSDVNKANEGLLLVAAENGIDIEAVKARIKANARAKAAPRPQKAAERRELAAQPEVGAGGGGAKATAKKSPRPAARAPIRKATAEEATQGIAAAMQNLEAGESTGAATTAQTEGGEPVATALAPAAEQGSAAALQGNEVKRDAAPTARGKRAKPVADAQASSADVTTTAGDPATPTPTNLLGVGSVVRVIAARGPYRKWVSKKGTVTQPIGTAWLVRFGSNNKHSASFDVDELEVLP